jgi:hypothetical protein
MKTVERIHTGPSPCSEQLVDDVSALSDAREAEEGGSARVGARVR